MDEKHVTFENLKTVISPVKHLIDNKADWNELKNKPFYTDDKGNIKKLDKKYIPGAIGNTFPPAGGSTNNDPTVSFDYYNFEDSGGRIDRSQKSGRYNHADSCGSVNGSAFSHAQCDGTVQNANYAMASGLFTDANQNYNHVIGKANILDQIYPNPIKTGWHTNKNSAEKIIVTNEINFNLDPSTQSFKTGGKIISSTLSKISTLKIGDKFVNESYAGETEVLRYNIVTDIDSDWLYYTQYTIGENKGQYIFIVGNGEDNTHRSNAHTIDWNGLGWFAGGLKVGGTGQDDEIAKTVATEEYVNTKINKFKSTPFIEGSGTTDSTAKTSTWIGNSDEITEYYDGLAIRYKIGVEGQSTITLNINGLGEKIVYRFNTTKLTTQFPVGSIINLIYHTDLNEGCWMCNDYDANTNTQQRVYVSDTKNVEYPITARYNTTSGSSYYAEYGRYSTGITLNPSKKSITATTFNGSLNGTAAKATSDASGNVIATTYATKAYVEEYVNETILGGEW